MDEQVDQQLDEARFNIVKIRIRKGKVQRRKKVASSKGFTIRKGKVVRMSFAERRNRKLSQRKGARKRKARLQRSLRKRKISLRKLKRLKNT